MARLDRGWHQHPRVLKLGLAAMGLHAWSISYCDAAETSGFIPMGSWPALPGSRAAVQALQKSGLWESCEGGYRLHDYLDYNRSREQIAEIRASRRASGHQGGLAKALAKRQQKPGETDSQTLAKVYPGPGHSLTPASSVIVAPGSARADAALRAREGPPTTTTTEVTDVPDEVRRRLAQAPIGA